MFPARRREENSPPENGLWYQVRFFYSPYTTAAVYWDNEIKRWTKELERYASQSPAISAAANQITSSSDTPEVKARKIYDAVQALDNTDFSRTKTKRKGDKLT